MKYTILFGAAALATACASPLPPVVMHGSDPTDPAAPATQFVPPPNPLTYDFAPERVEAAPPPEHVHDTEVPLFVCPMHPEVTAEVPGRCPICGMNLKIRDER